MRKVIKKIKIIRLEKKQFEQVDVVKIWKLNKHLLRHADYQFSSEVDYFIFGVPIRFDEINWHKDSFSNHIYPCVRFDNLNVEKYFNKGIDLVFPWEQSRFYFAPMLVQKYLSTNDKLYYKQFKSTALDWIENNVLMIGVNWFSTMDVAIRSINWIFAISAFGDEFDSDKQFKTKISYSLVQHAEYISKFPAIYKNGHTTNHTVSAYVGLLFLSLALKNNTNSKKWLQQAIDGLIKCIEYQVYMDGVDFEGSIPYHRLVLELFAYAAVVALSNNIKFPDSYYKKLFLMFEYAAAYIDKNGNAPQIGDNDSGRVLIFNNDKDNNPYTNEHDHSYLLDLGQHIFNYKFKSQCILNNENIINLLPQLERININNLDLHPRNTEKSISFHNGGSYILKNDKYSLLVACFPIGQNGQGGHNNLDSGSFTLSIDGQRIIVDPGTSTYTKDKKERDEFRSYPYHNTLFSKIDQKLSLDACPFWKLKNYYGSQLKKNNDTEVEIDIKYREDQKIRTRFFKLNENDVILLDRYEGEFFTRLNFHPEIEVTSTNDHQIVTNRFMITFNKKTNFSLDKYYYAPHYGKKVSAISLLVSAKDKLEITITNTFS